MKVFAAVGFLSKVCVLRCGGKEESLKSSFDFYEGRQKMKVAVSSTPLLIHHYSTRSSTASYGTVLYALVTLDHSHVAAAVTVHALPCHDMPSAPAERGYKNTMTCRSRLSCFAGAGHGGTSRVFVELIEADTITCTSRFLSFQDMPVSCLKPSVLPG